MGLLYKFVYTPSVNLVLRNVLKPLGKILGRPVVSVSGKINLNYRGHHFKLHTNQTSWVTQVLFFDGPENYEFTPLFDNLIRRSEVFFDVGANIGYFTVLAEKLNPKVRVFAFEPSTGSKHYLKMNSKENGLKNCTIIEMAVSDTVGHLTFHDVLNSKYPWVAYNLNGSNSLQNTHGLHKSHSYPVETTTLEQVVRGEAIESIDLLKLDTEFTEHIILRSSISVIERYRPVIICEVYDEIAQEIMECLNNLNGYGIYQIKENRLHPIKSLHEVEHDKEDRNFVFCHEGRLSLIEDLFAN